MAPFAHGLADIVALLPTLPAVLGRVPTMSQVNLHRVKRMLGSQATLKVGQDFWNVIF
jgi:hypothetical protein